jgi:hypothetical protein
MALIPLWEPEVVRAIAIKPENPVGAVGHDYGWATPIGIMI